MNAYNLDNFSSKLILITKLISIKIKNIQTSTYSDSGVIFCWFTFNRKKWPLLFEVKNVLHGCWSLTISSCIKMLLKYIAFLSLFCILVNFPNKVIDFVFVTGLTFLFTFLHSKYCLVIQYKLQPLVSYFGLKVKRTVQSSLFMQWILEWSFIDVFQIKKKNNSEL